MAVSAPPKTVAIGLPKRLVAQAMATSAVVRKPRTYLMSGQRAFHQRLIGILIGRRYERIAIRPCARRSRFSRPSSERAPRVSGDSGAGGGAMTTALRP